MTTANWDAAAYDRNHTYIWTLAQDLVGLLDPQSGERILDLGCGTGHLTKQIADAGATVLGMDSDPAMVQQAQANYPGIGFEVKDAADFSYPEPFDAVFSSAVLHWVNQPAWVATNVYKALKPGGRFVAEFGARDNVRAILGAVAEVLRKQGWHRSEPWTPWYFPSVGEYTSLLEAARFTVDYVLRFDRPTKLDGGEDGLRNWLEIFRHRLFPELNARESAELAREVEKLLRPTLFADGVWTADYVRLRFVARKRVAGVE